MDLLTCNWCLPAVFHSTFCNTPLPPNIQLAISSNEIIRRNTSLFNCTNSERPCFNQICFTLFIKMGITLNWETYRHLLTIHDCIERLTSFVCCVLCQVQCKAGEFQHLSNIILNIYAVTGSKWCLWNIGLLVNEGVEVQLRFLQSCSLCPAWGAYLRNRLWNVFSIAVT